MRALNRIHADNGNPRSVWDCGRARGFMPNGARISKRDNI